MPITEMVWKNCYDAIADTSNTLYSNLIEVVRLALFVNTNETVDASTAESLSSQQRERKNLLEDGNVTELA